MDKANCKSSVKATEVRHRAEQRLGSSGSADWSKKSQYRKHCFYPNTLIHLLLIIHTKYIFFVKVCRIKRIRQNKYPVKLFLIKCVLIISNMVGWGILWRSHQSAGKHKICIQDLREGKESRSAGFDRKNFTKIPRLQEKSRVRYCAKSI